MNIDLGILLSGAKILWDNREEIIDIINTGIEIVNDIKDVIQVNTYTNDPCIDYYKNLNINTPEYDSSKSDDHTVNVPPMRIMIEYK